MKDFTQIWNNITGKQLNQSEREMREFSNRNNRLKKGDIDTSAFEANFSECEGLNNKFNDDLDFNDRKEAIINRLFERRKKGQVTRQPKCLFMLLMFGFFAISAGCFILFLRPYDFFFKMKVELQDGGEIFEMWRKPSVDLYCRVFLFNVTNAEAYMAGNDTKLKLVEVGPYVYKELLEHNVTKFNDNGTLSAIPRHPLQWVDELSEGHKEDDILFLPNIALLSIANVVASQSFMTRFGLNNLIGITNSQPLVKMTAKEFMMGYKNELMTLGNTFMPGWIYFDKLGLIDRMYDFKGDYETIFTGSDDVSNSGLIDTYKGSTDLPQWDGKHCSNIQYASDGTKFKGSVSANESLLFYRKSLCRAAPLIPRQEGLKSGLKALMYTFPKHMLDNGNVLEENKCFCRHGKCLPEGLVDVTDCYYGFPIALSYPHFYEGDDVLFSKVEGLEPNKELHETRFWIQPESGLPLDVSAKFQINLALDDISSIKNTDKFANMNLPLLWFDIRMYSLPAPLEERFNLYLNILPAVEQVAMYTLFITGATLIVITVYRLTFKIMFKSFDNKKRNFFMEPNLWIEKEKSEKTKTRKDKNGIYVPCEIPLSDTDTEPDHNTSLFEDKRPPLLKTHSDRLLKTHSDRIKELSHKLSDKVYDSVGSIKDKVRDITHVKNIFKEEGRQDSKSLIKVPDLYKSSTNEAYRSDSSDVEKDYHHGAYEAVRQSDSEEDCTYLEVLDDGREFDSKFDDSLRNDKNQNNRSRQLKKLESSTDTNDYILHISD